MAHASARESARAEPARPPDEPEGRTVLLVDDEEDVRAVTAHMLERLGCSVLQAGDGREGVEVFRAHARLIDAVIVDLSLPRLSGDKVYHAIRDIRPDARVILMSGYSNEIATRGVDPGLAGFLRKPFTVADLRSTMGRALTSNGS
jgi:CheY-like chemotaxis protein